MDRLYGAWRKGGRLSAEALVSETEAFFAGRYLEVIADSAFGTPAWAQLNGITHAPPSDIRAWAESGRGPGPNPGSWPWAVALLAAEMTTLAGGDDEVIFDLQRDCLIPVELTLMGWSHHTVLPSDLVALCIPCLREHPRVSESHRPLPPGVRTIARVSGQTRGGHGTRGTHDPQPTRKKRGKHD